MFAPPPSPPSPPYPPFPPPQKRLSFWELRRVVKHLPPPQSWPEYYYQQSSLAEYRQRRFFLLWALFSR